MSYHGFEVGRQFSWLRVIFQVSNHFRNSKKLPSVVPLHYGFDNVGLITSSNDEFDALLYLVIARKVPPSFLGGKGGGGGGGRVVVQVQRFDVIFYILFFKRG